MRGRLYAMLACLAVPGTAVAQFPAGAEVREAKLLAMVGPQTRAWIIKEAASKAQQPGFSEAAASAAVRADYGLLGNLPDADIESLAMLVMMAVARDAQNDLREMMDDLAKLNQAKAGQRNAKAANPRLGTAQAGLAPSGPSASPPRSLGGLVIQARPLPRAEFDLKLESLRNNAAGLEEMRQTEELRLKLVSDRQSKLMEALARMVARMAQTSAPLARTLP